MKPRLRRAQKSSRRETVSSTPPFDTLHLRQTHVLPVAEIYPVPWFLVCSLPRGLLYLHHLVALLAANWPKPICSFTGFLAGEGSPQTPHLHYVIMKTIFRINFCHIVETHLQQTRFSKQASKRETIHRSLLWAWEVQRLFRWSDNHCTWKIHWKQMHWSSGSRIPLVL